MCDFNGFVAPEMVKKRQVVVVNKHSSAAKLVYVVPLSTTPPSNAKLALQLPKIPVPRPGQNSQTPIWIKCDMVYTVSTDRLSMPVNRSSRRTAGSPININISIPELVAVRTLVAKALRVP